MIKKTSFLAVLLCIILISGCGKSRPTTGTVTGMISGAGGTSFGIANNNVVPLDQNSRISFPVVPLRQSNRLKSQAVPNEKIIKFQPGISELEIQKIIKSMGGVIKKKVSGFNNVYVVSNDSGSLTLSALNNNSAIVYAEDNGTVEAFVTPQDTYFSFQSWNYGSNMLNLPAGWALQKGNSRVIVAVVDTGVSNTHPDLKNNLVAGWDFVNNDGIPTDTVYYDEYTRYSHGTHVAGIISAVTNNNIGIAGVAWNVKIMPVRVLDPSGSGFISDVASGITWAVDHGANVINLSLGGTSSNQLLQDAVSYADSNNVTVIAAAGNYNSGESHAVRYPAAYPEAIAVAAVDDTKHLSSYSCYGPEIDICAPGGAGVIQTKETQMILSTTFDKAQHKNVYVYMCGTSMAAPHIAGLAALLYSRGVTSPSTIKTRLLNGEAIIDYSYILPKADQVISGVPFGLAAVKVFYGLKDGTVGTYFDTGVNGDYILTQIQPGLKYICAFLDEDTNGLVDTGDKFGFYNPAVNVRAGRTIPNINISLSDVSGASGVAMSAYLADILPE